MPGQMAKLTAMQVQRVSVQGLHNDGGGLYLQVKGRRGAGAPAAGTKSVTKSWIFRYRDRTTGKLRDMGLGPYPDVTLERARALAMEARLKLNDGQDPLELRRESRLAAARAGARRVTFKQATEALLRDKKGGWKNEKHAAQWQNTLGTYAFPAIGELAVEDVGLPEVRLVLDPIWLTKNETASRVRQRVEAVLAWATVSGYRTGENPARWRGHLDQLLPKPSKVQVRKHHKALPWQELPTFMSHLRARTGTAAAALAFTVMTATRTSEVIRATWDEVDLDAGAWTIPASRMKAGKEHVIPLSSAATALLEQMKEIQKGPWVFPSGEPGAPLSNMAMAMLLQRMGRKDITVHGFRSTFRDWAAEQTDTPREVIEHALAHQLKDKAEAAYHRSTLLTKRKTLMDLWGAYCESKGTGPSSSKIQMDVQTQLKDSKSNNKFKK